MFARVFFLRQVILHQHFLRHKILRIYFACVVSLLSNINVQIFVTQTIVMQKILIQKNDVAKTNPQTFLQTYFCKKNFCVQIFCIYIFESDCVIKSAKKCCASERFTKKKRCANYGVINIQKFFHIYVCTCFFFVHIFLYA